MVVSYKKLWKLLIDRDMKKKDLQVAAGLSPSSADERADHSGRRLDKIELD